MPLLSSLISLGSSGILWETDESVSLGSPVSVLRRGRRERKAGSPDRLGPDQRSSPLPDEQNPPSAFLQPPDQPGTFCPSLTSAVAGRPLERRRKGMWAEAGGLSVQRAPILENFAKAGID
jgi:hypothetical protein